MIDRGRDGARLVVPRATVVASDGGAASGPTGAERSWPRSPPTAGSSRARPWRPTRLQAGDPVPRPARRRALVPHAPHPGRRGRPAPRALVHRGRRSPQPGRPRPRRRAAPRVARGARGRLSCPSSGRRPAQRRRDRRRRGPPRGRLRGRAAGRPVAVRETDKLAGSFAPRRRSRRSATGWRAGASSSSTPSPRRRA